MMLLQSELLLWLIVSVTIAVFPVSVSNCKMSEFRCKRSALCIRLDQICDGRDDCGDRSDEEPGCTPCNRTLYGNVGRTYRINIPRPRSDKLPFICYLNFVANQQEMGDVVQLVFDEFKLGRFDRQGRHGNSCPDGHMQLDGTSSSSSSSIVYGMSQLMMSSDEHGHFCGSVNSRSGRPVFISDGNALALVIRYFHFFGHNHPEESFNIRMRYKFIPDEKVAARSKIYVGQNDHDHDDGKDVRKGKKYGKKAGCSYVLTDCLHGHCRITSPNYPGIYPRNLTCVYRIRVPKQQIPSGMHPLISVRQPSAAKVHIVADEVHKFGLQDLSLGVDQECDSFGDSLTFMDSNNREIVRFCRGNAVPPVTSSGAEMLVLFRSSEFAEPRMANHSANGFQLDVNVDLVPRDSLSYTNDLTKCNFDIISGNNQASKSGYVTNVAHSLPANTSCQYNFRGQPGEVVWLTFEKFDVFYRKDDIYRSVSCRNRLVLTDPTDVRSSSEAHRSKNGEFCETRPPKLCDRALLRGKPVRACVGQNESYISSGTELRLTQLIGESTAVTELNFKIRYEFVTTSQDGNPLTTFDDLNWTCDRVFQSDLSMPDGSFYKIQSPRNVFLYGRGGRKDLHCTYTFRGRAGERVGLEIGHIKHGPNVSKCQSQPHPLLHGRTICKHEDNGKATMELWISNIPDESLPPLRKYCLCQSDDMDKQIYNVMSNTSSLRLELIIKNMNPGQDFDDFRFESRFNFLPFTDRCGPAKEVHGAGGRISLVYPVYCPQSPWLIRQSNPDKQIFLKIPGVVISEANPSCHSGNRVIVYTATNVTIICPQGRMSVEILSPGWESRFLEEMSSSSTSSKKKKSSSSSVIIELISEEPIQYYSEYVVQWLALSPPPSVMGNIGPDDRSNSLKLDPVLSSAAASASSATACSYACPELSGCIGSELWCDGVVHCPSGFDESEENCMHLFQPILYIYGGVAACFIVSVVIVILVVQRIRSNRFSSPSPGNSLILSSRSHQHVNETASNGMVNSNSAFGTVCSSANESLTDLVRPPEGFDDVIEVVHHEHPAHQHSHLHHHHHIPYHQTYPRSSSFSSAS